MFYADSREELSAWMLALERASGGARPPAGMHSAGSDNKGAIGRPGLSASKRPAASGPPPPLPEHLSIDGWPENGTELRARAEGVVLDRLRPAWFLCKPGAGPAGDPVHDPNATMIPLATKQTYTPTKSDVGQCLGCVVRGAEHPDKFRVVTCPRPVVAVDESRPGVRVALRSHLHHRYCDRRLRVCDSAGRYRQGEVVEAVLRGTAAEATGGFTIRWWRSSMVPGFSVGALHGSSGASSAAAAGGGNRGDLSSVGESAAPVLPPLVMSSDVVEGLEWEPIKARPLVHLPPSAAPHEPAPAFEQLSSPPPPGRPSPGSYPLFFQDIGRMIRCELVPKGEKGSSSAPAGSEPTGMFSNAIGPVEPATPKVRETWLEGPPLVGALLIARRWFFGGVEGATEISWHRITP